MAREDGEVFLDKSSGKVAYCAQTPCRSKAAISEDCIDSSGLRA